MGKFSVEIAFTQKRRLTVYARDAEAAEEKAVQIVEGWDGAENPEPTGDTERED